MQKPLFNTRTEAAITAYLRQPAHALLLTGDDGLGKLYLAQWLAEQMNLPSIIIEPEADKQTISIEQIRRLYTQTRGGGGACIVIRDAQTMGREAQNAFLKLLEEPPKETHFILTSQSKQAILPTIHSRTQQIAVAPLSSEQMNQLATEQGVVDASLRAALVHTLSGRPGALHAVTTDEAHLTHHKELLEQAKQFYAAEPYQRHLMLVEQSFDKQWLAELMQTLSVIVQTLMAHNVDDSVLRKRLVRQSKLLEETAYALQKVGGNPKIHATRLAQQL